MMTQYSCHLLHYQQRNAWYIVSEATRKRSFSHGLLASKGTRDGWIGDLIFGCRSDRKADLTHPDPLRVTELTITVQ